MLDLLEAGDITDERVVEELGLGIWGWRAPSSGGGLGASTLIITYIGPTNPDTA